MRNFWLFTFLAYMTFCLFTLGRLAIESHYASPEYVVKHQDRLVPGAITRVDANTIELTCYVVWSGTVMYGAQVSNGIDCYYI